MTGFLYKDLCIFRNMWKSYALVFAIFFALTLFGIYELSFMFTFIPILLCMGAVNLISVDEQVKWDRFAVAVPNGRVRVVREKYLFVLMTAAAALALEIAMAALLFLTGNEKVRENLTICVGSVAGCLLINTLSMPLFFRFGYQKARVIVIGVTALLAGGLGSVTVIMMLMLHGRDQGFFLIVGVLAALALVALPISYHISMKIYKKKEF